MPRKTPGPPCVICGESSTARELCEKHYKRWKRHGHINQTRPEDWGKRSKHPLWESWKWTARTNGRVKEWNDFWVFVSHVGERPSDKHRLKRRRTLSPFGPDNWYWKEALPTSTITKKGKSEYQRLWRLRNPLKAKNNELRSTHGITYSKYLDMLTAQGGNCAICGNKDEHFSLAVDHCHTSEEIRGLLCSQCNRGIGLFKDSIENFEKAIEYLRKNK